MYDTADAAGQSGRWAAGGCRQIGRHSNFEFAKKCSENRSKSPLTQLENRRRTRRIPCPVTARSFQNEFSVELDDYRLPLTFTQSRRSTLHSAFRRGLSDVRQGHNERPIFGCFVIIISLLQISIDQHDENEQEAAVRLESAEIQ